MLSYRCQGAHRLGRRLGLARAARRLLLCYYSIVQICAKVNTCSLLFATLTQQNHPGWNGRGGCCVWPFALVRLLGCVQLGHEREGLGCGRPAIPLAGQLVQRGEVGVLQRNVELVGSVLDGDRSGVWVLLPAPAFRSSSLRRRA